MYDTIRYDTIVYIIAKTLYNTFDYEPTWILFMNFCTSTKKIAMH